MSRRGAQRSASDMPHQAVPPRASGFIRLGATICETGFVSQAQEPAPTEQ